MERTREHVNVAIAGGGIGGLALGRALQLRGKASFAVFERDISIAARPQGYSLTIQGGIEALEALDVADKVRDQAGGLQQSGQHILSPRGRVALSLGSALHAGESSEKSKTPSRRGRNVFIPRQRLRKILAESLQDGTIWWGTMVRGWKEEVCEGRKVVVVSLSDERELTCDVLVAADGVHSRIRAAALADPLRYMGVMSICGINVSDHPLCLGGSVQVLDGRNRLFIKPFDGTVHSENSPSRTSKTEEKHPNAQARVMWQLTMPMAEEDIAAVAASPEQLLATAETAISGWSDHFCKLVHSTPQNLLRGGPLLDRDPDCCTPPCGSRVAFLGDAAHPMSPFKGQGANQALLDAVELAEALETGLKAVQETTREDGMAVALFSFHDAMRERVRRYVHGSRYNVEFLHTEAAVPGSESAMQFFGVRNQQQREQQAARTAQLNGFLATRGLTPTGHVENTRGKGEP